MARFEDSAVLELKAVPEDDRIPPFLINRGNILLIEDEAVIALDMANDIESWSYKLTGVVRTMEQALRSAEKISPDFAIVDIMLQGAHDGIEIAGALKEKFGTQIILLTAHSDKTTRTRIIDLKPLGYLFKPYSAHALRQMLETYELN